MSAHASIRAFCSAMGLPPQAPPLTLRFERSGDLHMECRDGFVAMYLTRAMPLHRKGVAAAALSAVHPDRTVPHMVNVAFYGEALLVLLISIAENSVDLPTLETAAQVLVRLVDEIDAAAR
ncbi:MULTISPECIES: hypothetical protein [unclassified Mesorhizobium]|uniref:hypothetical protein n=1 Tax=unclassified Mesorhizobium TaxID=325217 RepID=UPI000FC9FAC1|nr:MULTISPECIES: hypothetical protein [unclassified Mesorhizobium]RUV64375.1 hypothetical protein EOA85_01955 [Mesorhizobium sp. M5C.F.Ca.IN.020.29.1.1]RWC25227.1 MAG: hypothetical protein EOS51_01000 [Mesorhizobium sp.]RWD77513.1 MAG: hypothetical protein EOS48_29085 [Mesorhizobium sp.]RWE52613.1 MAG: hypothetical protein EOS67_29945 [Mesorhizobium sp.]RWE96104.1 MAG: hypothetical protein EOS68_18095 [Mesorhizobium sp.]